VNSRRDFIRNCAGLALATIFPATPVLAKTSLRVIKQLDYAYLLDVSPDSHKLCVYSTKNPYDLFRSADGRLSQLGRSGADKADALKVIELGSWKELISASLIQRAAYASFFGDSGAIYIQSGAPSRVTQRLFVDLRNGEKLEQVVPWSLHLNTSHFALMDRKLLGTVNNAELGQTDTLVIVALPDYKEIQRVPFAQLHSEILKRTGGMSESDIVLSDDRKAFAYAVEDRLVCRDAADIVNVWSQKVGPNLILSLTAISADAGVLAVCAGMGLESPDRNPRIEVFMRDAGTSKQFPIAQLVNAIAVSPDNKLLALAQNLPKPGSKDITQATIILMDIETQKELTRVIHDDVRAHQNPDHSIRANGLRFTADGKYLVSSGLHTKIWEIS